jgi:hypothetical protein
MFLKCDPYMVWCSIFYSKIVNCILFKIIVQHVSYLYVTYQKRHSNSVGEQEWLNAKWAIFHPYHGENKLYFKDICFKLDQHAQLDFYSDSSDTTVPGLTTHWFLWKVGEHAIVGKETLKFGSIFGSLPDFHSLRP